MDSIFRLAGELLRFKFTNIKWLKVCKNILSPFVFLNVVPYSPAEWRLMYYLLKVHTSLRLTFRLACRAFTNFLCARLILYIG